MSWRAPCRRSSPSLPAGHARPGSGSHARAVGQLLAVLAAHLPAGARVLELGTGAGAGTAWIACGLLPRTDVTVTTIEKDPQTAALAARAAWPQFVDLRVGDALDMLDEAGAFDLIFADAQGGKWTGLNRTIARSARMAKERPGQTCKYPLLAACPGISLPPGRTRLISNVAGDVVWLSLGRQRVSPSMTTQRRAIRAADLSSWPR